MKDQTAGILTRQRIAFIALLTFLFLCIGLWMVIPAPPIGFSWDDAWYLLMAEWLTPGSNYRVIAWTMLWVTSYPPLFPMFIALSGSGLADQQNAFIMNALFLSLGAGVAMIWFAREGFSAIAMALAAILVMFNPVTLGYLPILFSEFLFTFLATSALVLVFFGKKWKWNANWVLIGLLVGLSVATRSAGWALVAGFLLHLVFNRKLHPAVAFFIGMSAGILFIPFLKAGLPPPAVNYMDQLNQGIDNLDLGFLVQQAKGLTLGWSMVWGWGIGAWLIALVVLPGLIIRLKANRADAWYVMAYLGMLLLWPWPGHMGRFLWPLLPCLLVAMHSSFGLVDNLRYRTVLISSLLGFIVITSVPDGIGRSIERLLNPPQGELSKLSRMHEWTRSSTPEEGTTKLQERYQMLQDTKRIGEMVAPGSCIYSEMSALVATQARRVSYPSLWNSLKDVGQKTIRCEYYYMLPESISGTSLDDVNNFSSAHEELFRSYVGDAGAGQLPLGVFIRFRHDVTQ